jgi:hypothetical protein
MKSGNFELALTQVSKEVVFYILQREEWSKASRRLAAPDESQAARRKKGK